MKAHRKADKGALDLYEEAVHVLRATPAATLSTYYIGAIPFMMGALYFFSDMIQNPVANESATEAALALALLFLWMKFWQASFACKIRAQLALESPPRWTFRQSIRVFIGQAFIQPSGLFLIPVAMALTLPFAWVYAFYQNATALADAASGDGRRLIRRAWHHASLSPMQNHVGLGLGSLFALCVFLNCGIVAFAIPTLLKTLLGVETILSKSPMTMLNTTFFGAIAAVTYLIVDPLFKTVYALRCFYGDSWLSGEDLKADLKQSRMPAECLMAALALSLLIGGQTRVFAQAPIKTDELNRRIDQVIEGRKYAWRTPREQVVRKTEEGPISRFITRLAQGGGNLLGRFLLWMGRVIGRLFGAGPTIPGQPGAGGVATFLYVILAIALGGLAFVLIRLARRNESTGYVFANPTALTPDLSDENVGPERMPEEGWTKLGRELLERGEFRHALRAFYLATLAHLATRNLIGIARFKSNRDYQNELQRRGHAIPAVLPLFTENLSVFERIWYGFHEVDGEVVERFATNVEKIKSGA